MSTNRVSYIKKAETPDFSLFNECLTHVRQGRKLVYIFAGAAFVLSVVLALVVPHSYTGIAKVMPSLNKSSTSSMAAMIPGGAMFSETAGQTHLYLELLKSTTVKNRVLDEFNCGPESEKQQVPPPTTFNETALQKAVSSASFSGDFKSGVVEINTTIADRELSVKLANEFVHQLDLRLQELEQGAAVRIGGYFAEQVGEQRDKLQEIEDKNAEFLAKNRNYASGDDPELRREMERLKFDLEFNREFLLTLLGLKANNDLEVKKSIPRLVVIEWAETPPPKSYISRLKTIVMATVGAAMFAVGLIVLRRIYQWYIPQTTRSQLADSYETIGHDARLIAHRLKRPFKVPDKAGV